jgi:hypothetical protein
METNPFENRDISVRMHVSGWGVGHPEITFHDGKFSTKNECSKSTTSNCFKMIKVYGPYITAKTSYNVTSEELDTCLEYRERFEAIQSKYLGKTFHIGLLNPRLPASFKSIFWASTLAPI